MDEHLPKPGGQHVPGDRVGTVSDVGHLVLSLEPPPDPVVDTFGLPPVPLDLVVAVALVPRELLRALLYDLRARRGGDRHGEAGKEEGGKDNNN